MSALRGYQLRAVEAEVSRTILGPPDPEAPLQSIPAPRAGGPV